MLSSITKRSTSSAVSRYRQGLLVLRGLTTETQAKTLNDTNYSVLDQEWAKARPYSEVPRLTKFGMFTSFLPGGSLYNKSGTDLGNILRKNLGDLFVMPGIFGRSDILMVFNPDDIEKICRTEGVWPIRDSFETVTYFRTVVKKDFFKDTVGLLTSQGEDWGNLRKVVNPILMQPRNAKLYINSLTSVSDEFLQRIRDVRDPNTLEVPADFQEDITRLMFESVTSIALNKQFGLIRRKAENADAVKLFEEIRKLMILLFDLEVKPSMWKLFSTPKFREMMRCQEQIFDITRKFVDDAVLEIENQKKDSTNLAQEPSVLEKLLKINKNVAVVMAMDMLMAGVDATSTLFAEILLTLAKNPDKQDILRKEILSVLPEKNSPLTIEEMKNMPYLRACIKETMRLLPLAPGNFRNAGRDVVLNGYQIPKGTSAILNHGSMLTDEKYYSRPNEYLPERWLRSKDGSDSIHDRGHPFSFIPFGFGPRICVGKRIVDIQMEVALTKLLRNFKVEYDYPTENAVKQHFINTIAIPLKFKFINVE